MMAKNRETRKPKKVVNKPKVTTENNAEKTSAN